MLLRFAISSNLSHGTFPIWFRDVEACFHQALWGMSLRVYGTVVFA